MDAEPTKREEENKAWTITCPDRFCRAELPYTEWVKRGFMRCPRCGMLCYLQPDGDRLKLCSLGVYVRW